MFLPFVLYAVSKKHANFGEKQFCDIDQWYYKGGGVTRTKHM